MDFGLVNITSPLDINQTFPEPYRRKFLTTVFGSVFTIFLALISISGNLAVVFASCWDKVLKEQTSNILLVYLSLTDILTGFLVMIPGAVSVAFDYWPLGDFLCRLHAGLAYFFTCLSSVIIASISLDRSVAVMKPLQYNDCVTTKKLLLLCILLFFWSGTLLIPTVGLGYTNYEYAQATCIVEKTMPYMSVFAAWSCTICGYIPGLIMIVCNVVIILVALKPSPQTLFIRRKKGVASKTFNIDSTTNKTTLSIVVIVIIYLSTYCFLVISKHARFDDIDGSSNFSYPAVLMSYVSSAVNPFIYGILRKDYRHAYKKIPRVLYQKFFG